MQPFCVDCTVTLPPDEISSHLEDFHVGPRLFEHVTISCISCDFRTTAERLNLMIRHSAISGHPGGGIQAEWGVFIQSEMSRMRQIVIRGAELTRPVPNLIPTGTHPLKKSPRKRKPCSFNQTDFTAPFRYKSSEKAAKKRPREKKSRVSKKRLLASENEQTEPMEWTGTPFDTISYQTPQQKQNVQYFEECEDSKENIFLLPEKADPKHSVDLANNYLSDESTEDEIFVPKSKGRKLRNLGPKPKRKSGKLVVAKGPKRPVGRPRRIIADNLESLATGLSTDNSVHKHQSSEDQAVLGEKRDASQQIPSIETSDRDSILDSRMDLEDLKSLFSDPVRSLAWLSRHKLLANKVFCTAIVESDNRVCGKQMVLNKSRKSCSKLTSIMSENRRDFHNSTLNQSENKLDRTELATPAPSFSELNQTLGKNSPTEEELRLLENIESPSQPTALSSKNNHNNPALGKQIDDALEEGYIWKCIACRRNSIDRRPKKKSIKTSSFFSGSHFSIGFIVRTIWCWAERPRATLKEVLDLVGFSRGLTIVFMYNRMRDLCEDWCRQNIPPQRLGGEGVVVELDRSILNRANGFGRVNAKAPGQWKIGLIERESNKMGYYPLPDTSAEALLDLISEWLEPGSVVISDCWDSYGGTETLAKTLKMRKPTAQLFILNPRDPDLARSDEAEKWEELKQCLIKNGITPRVKQPRYLFEYMFRRAMGNDNIFSHTLKMISQLYPVNRISSDAQCDEMVDVEA